MIEPLAQDWRAGCNRFGQSLQLAFAFDYDLVLAAKRDEILSTSPISRSTMTAGGAAIRRGSDVADVLSGQDPPVFGSTRSTATRGSTYVLDRYLSADAHRHAGLVADHAGKALGDGVTRGRRHPNSGPADAINRNGSSNVSARPSAIRENGRPTLNPRAVSQLRIERCRSGRSMHTG